MWLFGDGEHSNYNLGFGNTKRNTFNLAGSSYFTFCFYVYISCFQVETEAWGLIMSTETLLLLVLLLWTALLQHDHQELGVGRHQDLVARRPHPEEGEVVGGIEVPHHGPGVELERNLREV